MACTVVLAFVLEEERAFAFELVVLEVAYVPLSFQEVELAVALFFVVFPGFRRVVPRAFVELAVGVVVVALALLLVVLPLALVAFFALEVQDAVAVAQAVGYFAWVSRAYRSRRLRSRIAPCS